MRRCGGRHRLILSPLKHGTGSPLRRRVPFTTEFECRGPVEEWLAELMLNCINNFREQLETASNEYVEMPRDKWLEKYCAQVPDGVESQTCHVCIVLLLSSY